MERHIDRRSVLKAMGAGIGATGLAAATGGEVAAFEECSTDPNVSVSAIDATAFPSVSLQVQLTTEAADAGELDESDFTVQENGTERSLTCFQNISEEGGGKVDIVFVFDDTGSMGGTISTMQRNTREFANNIDSRGLDARYALLSFKDNNHVDQDFTRSVTDFKSAVSSLNSTGGGDGPEDSHDAIYSATQLGWRPAAQRIVVLVTGAPGHEGGRNSHSPSEITGVMQDENISLYTVAPADGCYASPGNSYCRDYYDGSWAYHDIARNTGGIVLHMSDASSFDRFLDSIREDITRGQYKLCYETPVSCSEEPQRIDVCVDEPELGRIAAGEEYATPEPGSDQCNEPPEPEVEAPNSPADPGDIEGAEEMDVTAVAGESVELDATDSFDPDGPDEELTYEWTFPDGTTASGEVVERTFDSVGGESVTLTVTDAEGATGETEVAVDVAERVGMNVTPTRPIDAVDCSGEAAAAARPGVGAGRAPDSVPADAPADPGRGPGGSGPGAAPGADGEGPGAAEGHDDHGRVGPSPGRAPVGGGGICDIPVLVQPADGIDPYHDIDVGTLRFGDADAVEGGGGAEPLHEGGHPASETSFAGSNTALLVHFAAEETGITADTEQVKLVAETDGASLAAADGSATVVASTELDR